ncbi:MAG: FixH family protein [Saprospiraceae bacterium]
MKFNWGTGIAIVYSLFVFGMLGAVFASRSHDPGLVQKDYYSLDINYQDRLDRKQNAALLGDRLRIGYEAAQGVIAIQFSPELGAPTGQVKLFRSATLTDDRTLKLAPDARGRMEIPASSLQQGVWNLEMEWEAGGKKYFNDVQLTVTRA